MTRFLTIPLTLFMALPLFADEPKTQPSSEKAPTTKTAPAASTTDSPMVQAMKRANRQGKKPARVITNETLRTSKGHVTTTTAQQPVDVPEPQLSPNELAEQNMVRAREQEAKLKELGAAKEKEAAEKRERRLAASAERAEEGLYEELDDDPAQAEREAEEAREKPPQKQ